MSVYRDLFVEVPQQLLEAAVREYEARAAYAGLIKQTYRPRPASPLLNHHVQRAMTERYGWQRCLVVRREDIDALELTALRPCRHLITAVIDEMELLCVSCDRPGLIGLIDRVVQDARRCYCVERTE